MYEKLAKRLVDFAAETRRDEDAKLAFEAADAIEDLENKLNLWRQGKISRWVSVTERLPKDDCQVLAYYGFDRGDGHLRMMFAQVLDYYARDPRPHFQHEGLNGMTVTHWQPLPELPKEEADHDA